VSDNGSPLPPSDSQIPETSLHLSAPDPPPNNALFGPNGLRAGWRLLISACLFVGGARILGLILRHVRGGGSARAIFVSFTPQAVFGGEAATFILYLLVIWIMSRIEARRMRDYGLGLRGAFGGQFWLGAVAGFASITALLGALKIAGVFQLGHVALHGGAAWKYAALWGLAFLFVGFQEECTARGYVLFTLSTGITFWPSAILTSLLFGGLHRANSGEDIFGECAAAGIGFFFCILVRKTGTLWPAIGFHAAWDWGETFFYGVPDSGLIAPGHLFSPQFAGGKAWLTGGSVGPEGSLLCLVLIVLLCIAAAFLPGRRFPDPEAVPDPRRHHMEPHPQLFPSVAKEF
jgi:hypothetical protein